MALKGISVGLRPTNNRAVLVYRLLAAWLFSGSMDYADTCASVCADRSAVRRLPSVLRRVLQLSRGSSPCHRNTGGFSFKVA